MNPVWRSRISRALATLGISLATALAFAAPLAHVHLDAADVSDQGFCGDHAPTGAPGGRGVEPCQLCVAGGHAPALTGAPGIAPIASEAATVSTLAAPGRFHSAPARRPGGPRAPPRPA